LYDRLWYLKFWYTEDLVDAQRSWTPINDVVVRHVLPHNFQVSRLKNLGGRFSRILGWRSSTQACHFSKILQSTGQTNKSKDLRYLRIFKSKVELYHMNCIGALQSGAIGSCLSQHICFWNHLLHFYASQRSVSCSRGLAPVFPPELSLEIFPSVTGLQVTWNDLF